MNRPYAESCVQNREPILRVLREQLSSSARSLLEIGSGTGQHAVWLAPHFPDLQWQTSDLVEQHPGIRAWLEACPCANVLPPIALDVLQGPWPDGPYDAAFSANTAHIMPEPAVEAMFEGLGRVLAAGALFLLYGPFNRGGRYTAPSNARFDQWLKAQDPAMGVRDLDWLKEVADRAGLRLRQVTDMPADNKTLCWVKL